MVHIEWAPLNIPLRRRLQTLTVGIYMCSLFILGLYSYFVCGLIFFLGSNFVKVLVIAYFVWIFLDRERAQNCLRGPGHIICISNYFSVRWMRDNFFWKLFREYFPVELVKTAELPPNKNYLLACFPHGVIGFGPFTNMCSDISKWNDLFPKVRVHLATLAVHFNSPIWREIIQSWGMVSASKSCLLKNLTTSNDPDDPVNRDGYSASAVGILIGGAEEALDARPGSYTLTLKNRKGFIRVAMESGAAIVPVFSFGENDLFDQLPNPPESKLRKFQSFVKEKTGIPPLVTLGRGYFQYSFGLLPQRRRIVQVVGAPIDVPQSDNPKEEDVEKFHKIFTESLIDLFEAHKAKYIHNPDDAVLVFK
ncbi:2-acylglycerol O-acyltransferase 2-like [Episyrphus balteatus]|uniref:2-acylglycerol O-acyltransferase 2-like n=1 Tax=Episyrphus balteatus TaxID=286459 RepID=UPI002485379E|nr:2-acylglycerol O-acyltransferase 2-like [Episyrphus balteatus]